LTPTAAVDSRLAFKAYEIEELADRYFFRPIGWAVAIGARAVHLTPNGLTLISALVGVAGGALLFWPSAGLQGFAMLVLHGTIDSADGQLARMTGRTTALGRLFDGLAGYVVHAAIFLSLAAALASRVGAGRALGWAVLAGICTAAHAQMYDYHRTVYTNVVLRRRCGAASRLSGGRVVSVYELMQRGMAGLHHDVERAIAARSPDGAPGEPDRLRYRAAFYRLVRGWNLLGDNTRIYAIGVLAWWHRLDLFFLFVLVPMNAVFVVMWIAQARADRRFLAGL
jgi:phosphatidylglycerophosphate synthase